MIRNRQVLFVVIVTFAVMSTWVRLTAQGTNVNTKVPVTRIDAGPGILLTPNPITTTGTIAIDPAVVPLLNQVSTGDVTIAGNLTVGVNETAAARQLAIAQEEGGNLIVTGNLTLGGYLNGALSILPAPPGGFATSIIGTADSVKNASNQGVTIAGGAQHLASSDFATIAGGRSNQAGNVDGTATFATVGGGIGNIVDGMGATVPGGVFNKASGKWSFAAGAGAQALHQGAFVWADTSGSEANAGVDGTVKSTIDNQFLVRATGGVTFQTFFHPAGSVGGASLAPGSGSWAIFSDRSAKEHRAQVDGNDVLQRLNGLSIERWNYKSQDASIRHMGPMAQDFHAAFGLGESDTHISSVDADGVALAGVQALYRLVLAKDEQLRRQDADITAARSEIRGLENELRRLQSEVAALLRARTTR